jgi:hypothetical protein
MLNELKALLAQLGNPKFLHHLLEPLLLWGIFFGVLGWALGVWVLKDRKAQIFSLILLALSSFAVMPVLYYRKKASPITALSAKLLNEQNQRRRDTQWVYYAMGSLAVLGIFMTGGGTGKSGTFVTVGIIIGGTATVIFSLWLHEKETSVFHPDSRAEDRKPKRAAAAAKGLSDAPGAVCSRHGLMVG